MSADNELRYKSSSMVADMLIGLEDAYNSREFSDVSLELGCRSFSCHRVILAAASPFFKAMFTSDMCEKGQSDVRISAVVVCHPLYGAFVAHSLLCQGYGASCPL